MKRLLPLCLLFLAYAICPANATAISVWYNATPTFATVTLTSNSTVGTEIQFTKGGAISGLAFWKASADTTTSRNLILWSTGGTNLAQCTTSAEPTGTAQWITCNLSTPYSISSYSTFWVSADYPTGTVDAFGNGGGGCLNASGVPNMVCLGNAWTASGMSTFPNSAGVNTGYNDVIFTPCF